MIDTKIVYALYGNKEHSELSLKSLGKMVSGETEKMLREVKIPITYSTHGEDIELYKLCSPHTLDAINSNSNIRITKGTYTPIMPTFVPGQMKEQAKESDTIMNENFLGKIESIRFFPEHDVHPDNFDAVGKAEPTIISDNQPYYEYRENLPFSRARVYTTGKHIVPLKYKDVNVPLLVNTGVRKSYLEFFRGMSETGDVIKAFESELQTAKKNGEPCITFLTDFEVPQINQINGVSRLDKWKELMTALKESELSQYFCHFSDVEEDVNCYVENSTPHKIDRRYLPKWLHSPISQKNSMKIIEEAERKGQLENPYFKKVAMHAADKDILSFGFLKLLNGNRLSDCNVDYMNIKPEQLQDKVIELPTKSGEKVRITSDILRLSEFQHFNNALKNNRSLTEGIDGFDPKLQRLFENIDHIYSK